MLKTPAARDALRDLLARLESSGYDFVTPTPATHARILARPGRQVARDLRDVFGWSLPFAPALLPPQLIAALEAAGAVELHPAGLKASLRVSRVGGTLFLHSAYPTEHRDAVFLGPDTYRFADFIRTRLEWTPEPTRIVDIGTGAGVGGVIAGLRHRTATLTLVDINPDALFLAEINAVHAGLHAVTRLGSGLDGLDGPFDLVLANPPFIVDPGARAYRDGGDMHGARISIDWAEAAARRLAPGGRLLLYTGSAIVDGRDAMRERLAADAATLGCTFDHAELDPDIFGEELDQPAYADVDRIAAVRIVMTRMA
ncbi:methyltransferase [Sphingomonas solaris]|uniref:methyltransferase n=1 Tax=Alterirhizorhabdus solaris TaxID=2529389 RepID=UPI001EF092CC|nr:methyltransferase [Sphingomonas solaris]